MQREQDHDLMYILFSFYGCILCLFLVVSGPKREKSNQQNKICKPVKFKEKTKSRDSYFLLYVEMFLIITYNHEINYILQIKLLSP